MLLKPISDAPVSAVTENDALKARGSSNHTWREHELLKVTEKNRVSGASNGGRRRRMEPTAMMTGNGNPTATVATLSRETDQRG